MALLPSRQPFNYPNGEVLGVGRDLDLARLSKRRQRLNGGLHLHPVVGRSERFGTRSFSSDTILIQNVRPTSGAGIAIAGTIGVDPYCRHLARADRGARAADVLAGLLGRLLRSEEHTSELQSLRH